MALQRVINLSGGQTSAYMTITEYKLGDIVLFCDTGREHPKTYKFLNDFEANEGIRIHRTAYDGIGFDALLKKNGYKRIPNRTKRICTVELKISQAKRYLKSIGVTRFENLLGFRKDEPRRVLEHKERFVKVKTVFPLYEKGITKQHVDAYWSTKPYRLEIPRILGNCTLCFLKGKNAIMAILREYPELAEPWIKDEQEAAKTFGHTYLEGTTIKELRDLARHNLFKGVDLGDVSPAFTCLCTT